MDLLQDFFQWSAYVGAEPAPAVAPPPAPPAPAPVAYKAAPKSALGSVVRAAGYGFFAYALVKPLWFQKSHPIWGGLFALGSLSALVGAASSATKA